MRILIVGCGDVGLRAARRLRGRARVYGLTRSPERAAALRAAGVVPVIGDLDDRASLARLTGLADAVLHFAPPPAEGNADPRTQRLIAALARASLARRSGGHGLTVHGRQPLRVEMDTRTGHERSPHPPPPSRTRARGASRSAVPIFTVRGYVYRHGNKELRPHTVVYISTSGVYGDCGGERVAETRPVRPHNDRAKRRVDAERRLRIWAGRSGRRITLLRAPGIYAQDRMPEARVRQGLPALMPAEDIYTNHIHAEDLARLAVIALFRGRPNRVYNAVDDSGLKMGDWFDVVADHLGLPRPPRQTRAEVMAAVTPAMRTFLSESRRLTNARIKQELRYRLLYPTVREGLTAAAPG